MKYFLVTKPVDLRNNTMGRPTKAVITFDPATLPNKQVIIRAKENCEYGNYTSKVGETFHKQELNLSTRPMFSQSDYWISQTELKTNEGLIEFPKLDHNQKYVVLKDTKGHDNCCNSPESTIIPEGAIIQFKSEYCTRRGDHFFTIKGDIDKQSIASPFLTHSPSPSGSSYYNPLLLEPVS